MEISVKNIYLTFRTYFFNITVITYTVIYLRININMFGYVYTRTISHVSLTGDSDAAVNFRKL